MNLRPRTKQNFKAIHIIKCNIYYILKSNSKLHLNAVFDNYSIIHNKLFLLIYN